MSADRSVQFGMASKPYIGPIPWTTIRERSRDYGGEADDFAHCIKRMDATYLSIVREGGDRPKVDHSQTFGPQMMRQG